MPVRVEEFMSDELLDHTTEPIATYKPRRFGPKQSGRCLACSQDVYEIRSVYDAPHPLAGHPKALGPPLPNQTQVRFLLANGTTADVAFCLDCAAALEPDDFWPIWRACVARNDLALKLAGRSETVRRADWLAMSEWFPLAIVARRTASPDGLPMMDRR